MVIDNAVRHDKWHFNWPRENYFIIDSEITSRSCCQRFVGHLTIQVCIWLLIHDYRILNQPVPVTKQLIIKRWHADEDAHALSLGAVPVQFQIAILNLWLIA